MFSKRFYHVCAKATRLGRKLGATLLIFDEKEQLFHNSEDPKLLRQMKWNYNTCVLWALVSFSTVLKYYKKRDIENYYFTLFYWFLGTITLLCYSCLRFYSFDFCRWINGILIFFRYFHGTHMPVFSPIYSRLNRNLESVLTLFGCSWTGNIVVVMIMCVYDPQNVIFQGSLIPEQYYAYFPMGILVTSFHLYLMLMIGVNIIITNGLCLVYAVYLTEVLTKELRFGRRYYRTLEWLRKPTSLMHVYRSFQVLHNDGLSFLGIFILLGHWYCVITPIFCCFILITYWDQLQPLSKIPIVLGVPSTMGFWTVVLQLGKYLFVRGDKILWSWQNHNWNKRKDHKIMERFRWSCQPILIRHGNQLVLAGTTQFNYFKGIIRGTLRALLTIK